MKTGWQIFARLEPMYMGHSLVMIHEDHLGRSYVKSLAMEKLDRHGHTDQSQQAIPHKDVEDFLRAMMDAAWELGIRPTGYENHANELNATRYHLEDMRQLALPSPERDSDG